MKTITSVQNEEIKNIVDLHSAKNRKAQNKFIAEGLRICSTLIASQFELIQIYTTEKNKDYVFALANPDKITLVSEKVMDKISASSTPSGILAIFEIPKKPSLDQLTQGLVLYNISDPGNIGTLIRTCAAVNIKTIIKVDGADIWSPKVIQSSAGTIAQVNIFEMTTEEILKIKNSFKFCAMVVSGGKKPQEINFENTLLIVGNEAHGIPQYLVDQCDEKLTLPMPGNTESLNAAIAGSIAAYLAFNK